MTLYVRLKIVVLALTLLLTGINISRGEVFLSENKAAIRATASVEAPAGLLSAGEIKPLSAPDEELDFNPGAFLFYPGQGGVNLEIEIDGVRMDILETDNSPVIKLEENSNIKLLDPTRLLEKNTGAETVTFSIIYTGN